MHSVCDIEFGVLISINKIIIQFCSILSLKLRACIHFIVVLCVQYLPFVLDFFFHRFLFVISNHIVLLSGVCLCCNYQLASIWCLYTWHTRFVSLFPFLISVFLSSLFSFLFVSFRSHSLFIFFEISKLTFCTFCRLIYVFKIINKRHDQQMIFFWFLF